MIQKKYLELVPDRMDNGRPVLSSRLGYRITAKFVHDFFGRIFDNPLKVFDEAILCPEKQDPAMFVDGVNNIVESRTAWPARTWKMEASTNAARRCGRC